MNLDHVLGACERLPDIGITHRRTAISTVGWIPGHRAPCRRRRCRCASRCRCTPPTTALRSELMPVNDRYPLAGRARRVREPSTSAKRRKVFVEYVMLAGVNDGHPQAAALAAVARPAHVQGQPDPVQPDRLAATRARARRRSPRSRPSSSATGSARPSGSPGAATSTPPADSSRREPGRRASSAPRHQTGRARRASTSSSAPDRVISAISAARNARRRLGPDVIDQLPLEPLAGRERELADPPAALGQPQPAPATVRRVLVALDEPGSLRPRRRAGWRPAW